MYLGDCAALTFLQNIQELIEGETELATIAADVGNFPVYEEMPPVRDNSILAYNTTDKQDIEELVEVFFASVWYLFLGDFDERTPDADYSIRPVAFLISSDGFIWKIF